MNRRPRALPARAALLCACLLAITVALSSAAPAVRSLPRSVQTLLTGARRPQPTPALRHLSPSPASPRLNADGTVQLPAWAMPGHRPVIDLRRVVPAKGATVQAVGAIGSTNSVPHQSVDQTTFPRPPAIGTSTVSDDVQPVWSPREDWIYFASNRSNPDGTAKGQNYHIWRMSGDGSVVQQVTGMTPDEASRDQFTPAIAPNGLIAFSERAGAGQAANIIVLDTRTPGTRTRTQVTGSGLDPRYVLGDAIGPTWSPSSDTLAFAANKTGVYNIFTVSLRLGDVFQLTNGTTANGIDCRDPNWSPGGTLIAFDSNAAGVDSKTGLLAGTQATRNVFVTYSTGPNTAGKNGANTQPFVQMTSFAGANSIEPAFSVKAGSNAPNDTNGMSLLAFASQRGDVKDTGTADTVVSTYHLFWIIADDGTNHPSTTNAMPEDPMANPAEPIFTQDTNPNVPAANRYKSDERHPYFPPFIRSIRVAYASDLNVVADPATGTQTFTVGNHNNIWTTPFVDVNSPSLEAVSGTEIVRVARVADASPAPDVPGRQEFVAGEKVVIMARAVDLESGIARTMVGGKMVPTIYAQIRNPNGKYQGVDGMEHKTYQHMNFMMQGPAPQNPIAPITIREGFNIAIPQEVSSQVLDARDPTGTKYSDPFYPNTKDVTPKPDPMRDPMCPPLTKEFAVLPPTYIPGQSDASAWSGKKFAPRGEWLPLYDDGPVSQGGHEPEGQVAGDGVFSNVWQTPPLSTDYLLDIITYDRAVDPLGRGPGQNWKIWDNVWGFTTQPFNQQNPVLAVMDYPEGQRFLGGAGGGRFTGGGSTPVESYLLDLDTKLMPKTLAPMDIDACPPEMPDALVSGTYGGKLGPQNTIGTGSFRGDGYDVWRVICRGPVPRSILLSYAPQQVQQVDPAAFNQAPSQNGTYSTITVPVAEKAVYWASPYSGDLWVGPGTITDASTQALLTEFVKNYSGRLFITGQDIGWALTLNGSLDNSFYKDVLKAKFVSDAGVDENQIKLMGVTDAPVTDDWPNRDIASPLSPLIKEDPADPYPQSPTSTRAPDTLYIGIHGTDRVRTDGALNQGYPDHILPLAGALPAYAYADGLGDGAIYSIDPTTNGRVVYLSFGLEALLREYDSSNPTIVLNFRSKLLHNALCWATTGEIRGRVVNVSGLTPVAGAVVRAIPNAMNTNGAVTRTAVTDADGNYVIQGLVPQPSYDIQASVPGFTSQHLQSPSVHGVAESLTLGDLLVSAAAPGSISGTVRSSTGSAVPGAVVLAKLTAAPGYLGQTDFFTSTDAQGFYKIGGLPVGSYTVRIDPTYLSGSGYNGANPQMQTAGVQAATESSGLNFTLGGGTTVTTPTQPGSGTGTAVGGASGGTGVQSFTAGQRVLFSVPYDYPNDDAATVLNVQPSDLRHDAAKDTGLATYLGDAAGYSYYPAAPANTLRLGRGYFLRASTAAVITKTGTPAPTNQPFSIGLATGWNLIGDPFPGTVKWSSVKVQVPGQGTALTTTAATQQGILKSGLMTLSGGSATLEAWHGYWVRASQPVTLLIPPPSVSVATASVPLRASPPEGGPPPPP